MSDPRWAAAERYLDATLLPDDATFRAALAAAERAGLPPIQVSPSQGRLLALLARLAGARRVLEVGTLAGYSTLWLLRGMPPDGRVVTLELDPRHAAVARENFARAGVAERVELRVGDASDALAAIVAEEGVPFDFVFIDADKERSAEYVRAALRLTRTGGVIVLDNVVRGGAVADPDSADPRVRGIRAALEILGADPRVEATALQTVGAKAYDGFAVAVVTGGA